MNSAEMKAKLAQIRFDHDNGDHDFNEDSDHVSREACTSCFLISVIDTMVARSWDPNTGGPAREDYSPGDFGDADALNHQQLDSWLEETRGVVAPVPAKDRILALLTSGKKVNEILGKALIIEFAGQVEERTRRQVLEAMPQPQDGEGRYTNPDGAPFVPDAGPEKRQIDLARIIGQGMIDEIRRQG